MRDRSQQVHLLNSGLLSPWRGGLLETTPAEARVPLGQSGLGPTLPLSFADCREEDVGKNVPDCFGEVPPQVGPRPRCPWEDPWVVVGTHKPPTGLFCPPHVGTHDGSSGRQLPRCLGLAGVTTCRLSGQLEPCVW